MAPIAARASHMAAWTGSEMLVWGGYDGVAAFDDGAAYDPATDTWRLTKSMPADIAGDFKRAFEEEFEFAHIWTGSEWIVAYKSGQNDDYDVAVLAAYNPSTDAWRSLPSARVSRTDVYEFAWTGEDLVLGHFEGMLKLRAGATEWTPIASTPGDLPIRAPWIWTGDRLIASIHRFDSTATWAFLASWDPILDRWQALPMPPRTIDHAALVTDGQRIIAFGSGLAFDMDSNTWWEVPMSNNRPESVSIWTGREMIVWGGWRCGKCVDSVYDTGLVFKPDW